ncbi:MAG TPA: M12 family metallo-peptidase [Steroidobacteraceae bacterium]|nr:M12 family metallo-peptidase [Steroidobacteraceae bacterium]
MARRARLILGAVTACVALSDAAAAPAYRILYHEAIHLRTREVAGHTQRMSFEAYGRHFSLLLQTNEGIQRAVPADRPDIETLRGTLDGQPGSWARMTRTRSGWRGVVSDGHDLYALEPAGDLADSATQPPDTAPNAPMVYRLSDAILSVAPGYCRVLSADGTPLPDDPATGTSGTNMTAQMLADAVASDVGPRPSGVDLKLSVSVVADYEFYQQYSDDPEGTIISRMDIVDGIYTSQVGVKIDLAPITIIKTRSEPFTKTDPEDLLAQVRQYRGAHPSQMSAGVTHLMTGRNLDGSIIGIAYLGSVCNGNQADSLSEGGHSTSMSALIAAHEIGHNFNAPHDGVPGACASTPQTFLMAPRINFSNQFSACSLQQISARIQSAQCLSPYTAPDIALELATGTVSATTNTAFTLSFSARALGDDASEDVVATASLPAGITVQSATADGGTCTTDSGSVTCTFGSLNAGETHQIDLHLISATAGTSSAALSVSSSNDNVSDNDTGQVTITVNSPPSSGGSTPPTASANGSDDPGTSGGGGGRIDALLLAALAFVIAAKYVRKTSRVIIKRQPPRRNRSGERN